MSDVITENLDLWTSALLTKSTAGRGSNGRVEAYGIKKLRELILELAVRGKLVPQDPKDEPASYLLERSAKGKSQLVKKGVIGRQKELPPMTIDELPFALPTNWAVERLGAVSHLITKGTTPTSLGYAYVDSGVSFVKVENIDGGQIQGDTISQFIDKETNQALERSQLAEGDVLFSIAGTIGKTCIVYEKDLPANTNQALAIIRGTSSVFDTRYLLIQLDSFVAEATRAKARGGAMPNVSLGDLNVLVLPVPPLAEQHRIVAKVDELMALCNQLEQQQSNNIEAHQTLVETLLGTLTNIESQQELNEAWTRIADHFDTLFTTEQSIDQLKQTILQLAVMGMLVSQDPNDEPASALLEKFSKEKIELVKKGKIRRQKELPSIDESEVPFVLPASWEMERLGNISHLITKGTTPTTLGHAYVESGISFIKVENIDRGRIQRDSISQFIDKETNQELQRSQLEAGDVLFSIAGTIGKTCIVHEDDLPANTNQALAIIRGTSKVFDIQYLLIQLDSHVAEATRAKARGGAMPNVSLGDLTELVLPLPPLAEQHRIVAKVNELMTLCDALKARLAAVQTTQIHLADAIVEQAVA